MSRSNKVLFVLIAADLSSNWHNILCYLARPIGSKKTLRWIRQHCCHVTTQHIGHVTRTSFPSYEVSGQGSTLIHIDGHLFCGFPGYNPVPLGWFKMCVCWFYDGKPKGSVKVVLWRILVMWSGLHFLPYLDTYIIYRSVMWLGLHSLHK